MSKKTAQPTRGDLLLELLLLLLQLLLGLLLLLLELRHLVLRGASPQIFAGARQSLSIGIILMVISEMFAASNGIGFTIVQFQRTFAIPQMWSGIILLGIIGVLLAFVFRAVEGRALRWYIGLRAAQRGE